MAEVTIFPLITSLTAAISTTSRPVTFTVATTTAALGAPGATFSALVYDAGTDANPAHAEAFIITSGGGTLSWTGTTESGSTAFTHANGSTVVATVITPRSLAQPLTDHITEATTPDPHTLYMRKSNFLSKGDILVGTGSSTFARLPAPSTIGAPLVSDPTTPYGIKWSGGGAVAGTNVSGASLAATAVLSAIPGGARLSATASLATTTTGTVGAASTTVATIVADGLTSVTFGGIGTYNNLRLTGTIRSGANILLDLLKLQINGDQNASYSTEGLTVSGATALPSQLDTNNTYMSLADVPGEAALVATSTRLKADMPNPSGGMHAKGILAESVCIASNAGLPVVQLEFRGGIWRPQQQTPITSITLSLATGPFATGSTFTLVGEA